MIMYVDTVNACNLKCPTCPRGSGLMETTNEVMDINLFRKIVEKGKNEGFDVIALYNWTEPFLNKRLADFVSIIKQFGLRASLSTNLSLPEIPHLAETLKAGVNYMIVSVSGDQQDIHRINHVGSNLENVFKHLRLISDLKKQQEIQTVVDLKLIEFSYNTHCADTLKTLASDLNLRFQKAAGRHDPLNPPQWKHEDHNNPKQHIAKLRFQSGMCKLIFGDPSSNLPINHKGDVYLCCALPYYNRLNIGHYLDLSQDEIIALRYIHPACRTCNKPRIDVDSQSKTDIIKVLFPDKSWTEESADTMNSDKYINSPFPITEGHIESVSDYRKITPDMHKSGIMLTRKLPIHVKGWTINSTEHCVFNSVYIAIDETEYKADIHRRPDFVRVRGEDKYLMSGFRLEMPISDLALGEHVLKVFGVAADGQRYVIKDSVKLIIEDTALTLEDCISLIPYFKSFSNSRYSGFPKQTYILAATPRSGSNLLDELLRKTELAGSPAEYLNTGISSIARAMACSDYTFDGYLSALIDRATTPNGVFGIKTFPRHYFAFDCPLKDCGAKYIHISRRNKVLQGISLFKAARTNSWTSRQESSARKLCEDDFSRHEISKLISYVVIQEEMWQRFFRTNNIEPVRVVYEDFIEDIGGTISRVLKEALDIDFPAEQVPAPNLQKQTDELSEYYYNRLMDK